MMAEEGQDASQVGNHHVRALGELDPGRELLEELDPVRQAVGRRELVRHLDRVGRLDRVDPARAELAGQQREVASAGADVDDDPPPA
jgi:hypothetical protein